MADQTQDTTADNATATDTVAPLMPEFGPAGPPAGDDSPKVDADLVMSTFFDGQNPASSQAEGSTDTGGQTDTGSLAPPQPAPAANGEDGSSQPGPSSTQPPKQGEGGTGAQTPVQPQQGSTDQQPPSQLSVEDRLALASLQGLREQNEQLIQRLRAMESGQTQPQAGQQSQPNQTGTGQEQIQRLSVPDPIAAAIMNEDPVQAKQGMDMLLTATVHTAVQAAIAKITPMIEAKVNEGLGALQGQTEVQKMEQAFFERFPHLNNPLYKPLIQETTEAKYKAFPNAKWDELMMDAVGSTVIAKLGQLGINVTPIQSGTTESGQAPPKQETPPKPAPMLDGTNRSGVPQDDKNFIASTFS